MRQILTRAIALVYLVSPLACSGSGDAISFGPLQSFDSQVRTGPPRAIVVGQPGTDPGLLRALVASENGVVHRELGLINALSVTLPDQAAAARIDGNPAVLRVDADVRVFASAPPGACSPWPACKDGGGEDPPPDPQVTPWGVTQINADATWGSSTGAGVKVVVIDTGIDDGHLDLAVAGGINFSSAKGGKPSAWKDDNGHGTHVAGTIAALDNSADVVGVAPGAELWACKALDRNGSGWLSDVIACIDWAVTSGMQVINMSLGSSSDVLAMQEACDAAKAAGVVTAAAAGNSGDGDPTTDDVGFPAGYASTIAVAATDINDTVAYFSSDGAAVSVAAPGVNVLSTRKGGGTVAYSGTSMASPHTAGAAALLLEDYALTPDCVQTLLESTAVDLGDAGWDPFYGNGRIDAAAAYAAAAVGCP